jgi:hypothetical protein
MSNTTLAEIAQRIAPTGRIEDADVVAVRRMVFSHEVVTRADAEGIYAIEHARRSHCAAWSTFFVEALTDYMLNQVEPVGYLSEDNAAWVTRQVRQRKEPSTDGDLELVTNLIEQARDVPASFSAFALRLVKEAVIYSDGPDARGRLHAHGRVTDADVAMLQRVLWGAGPEGLLAVSRDEAEALFAIADATTGADNDPTFDDLFAKAIGNYLIGATGRTVPSRADALRWEGCATHKADIVAALSGALKPAPIFDTLRNARTLREDVEHEHMHRNVKRELAIEVAAIMTPEKAGWLLDRVERNGLLNGPERALVRFIAREAGHLDPALDAIIAKVA